MTTTWDDGTVTWESLTSDWEGAPYVPPILPPTLIWDEPVVAFDTDSYDWEGLTLPLDLGGAPYQFFVATGTLDPVNASSGSLVANTASGTSLTYTATGVIED